MARIRTIKPDYFKNEQLADCSFAARLLFQGLWTQADREGRLEDRPKRLKAEIFPYDNVDVNELLKELEGALDDEGVPLIHRYQVGMKSYIWVVRFRKHQQPNVKETASQIPPPESLPWSPEATPPETGGSTERTQSPQDAGTMQAQCRHGASITGKEHIGKGTDKGTDKGTKNDDDSARTRQPTEPDPDLPADPLVRLAVTHIRRVPKFAAAEVDFGNLEAALGLIRRFAPDDDAIALQLAVWQGENTGGRLAGAKTRDPVGAIAAWMERHKSQWKRPDRGGWKPPFEDRSAGDRPKPGRDYEWFCGEGMATAIAVWPGTTDPFDADEWQRRRGS